jgi:cytochrome b6-f complex iron-sulfur subunit
VKRFEMKETVENNGRRQFLSKMMGIIALIAGAEVVGLLTTLLWPRSTAKATRNGVKVGSVQEFAPGTIHHMQESASVLIRLEDGGFLALSLRCTHLGCISPWEANEDSFVCPCHGSGFDLKGDVLYGPAPRALDFFAVWVEDGQVWVDTSQTLTRQQFDKTQAAYA